MTVAEINFGDGSWDDARGLVQNILQQLVNDVQGNGKDGIKTILAKFIAQYEQNRNDNIEFQAKRDKENAIRENRRWKTLTVVLTMFGLILGALTYLEANRQVRDHTLTIPPTLEMHKSDPVVSYSQKPPQDASEKTW